MTLTPGNLFLILDAALFILGFVICLSGVLILAFRASSADLKTLAHQAARLAQKGLADEVSGIVGNATALLDSLEQLVRTTRGIGMFLALLGVALMATAVWFALQIVQVQP